ncbi:hypothetical protein H8B13_16710 [Hymenobacter sp. BT188]|uniref:hypothetical protein n=1 Tax=Hymenobacter sp. BT188 TaxID=2763504 RepID=UPI001650E1FF|nr:hypothetical protein [Hymenobacter sp. BT188]MBC6608470.1 hypothetical protein [Hymenobacter sp. BT188]
MKSLLSLLVVASLSLLINQAQAQAPVIGKLSRSDTPTLLASAVVPGQGDKSATAQGAGSSAPIKAVPQTEAKRKPKRVTDATAPEQRATSRSARGARPEHSARSARGGTEAGRGASRAAGAGRGRGN